LAKNSGASFIGQEGCRRKGDKNMMDFIWCSAIVVFLFMVVVFALAALMKDNSIVDIAWGLGFICVVLFYLFYSTEHGARQILVSVLVVIWGIRLAVHIALRKRGKGEDWRYARWRKQWKNWFYLRSFLQIYMLQGIFLLIIVYPAVLVLLSPFEKITVFDILGTAVWIVGFIFETVGDHQLSRFKNKPESRGQIMTSGLWKYTRHPNYFGEATMWWGIFAIALSVPLGWTAIISPLLITVLLLKVSGVSMLEKKYADNTSFRDYASKTSVFFPWFPRGQKKK
jgi:steroid 5-alpha reductase family enzyme